jgi:hypothetical protein
MPSDGGTFLRANNERDPDPDVERVTQRLARPRPREPSAWPARDDVQLSATAPRGWRDVLPGGPGALCHVGPELTNILDCPNAARAWLCRRVANQDSARSRTGAHAQGPCAGPHSSTRSCNFRPDRMRLSALTTREPARNRPAASGGPTSARKAAAASNLERMRARASGFMPTRSR